MSEREETLKEERDFFNFFKRSKLRKDLFSNKNTQTTIFQIMNSNHSLESALKLKNANSKTETNHIKERNNKHFETLSPLNLTSNRLILNSFSSTFHNENKDIIEKSDNIICPSSSSELKSKIVFSNKFKEIMRKYQSDKKFYSQHLSSKEEPEKPKIIIKNRKKFISFKNKIIQVEKKDVENLSEESRLKEEQLFNKFLKNRENPTHFALRSHTKFLSP